MHNLVVTAHRAEREARAVHDASLEEVRLLEERRDSEAATLQEVERRETALRYEVGELSATAEDLNYQLERLDKETVKDEALKTTLLEKSEVLEDTRIDLGRQQERLQAYLSKTGGEPDRIRKQGDSVHRAASTLDAEVRRLQLCTAKAEQEAENIREKRQQATELKRGLIEKLELQRDTLQHRQKDVEVVTTNLEMQRAKNHQLLTERVELTLQSKEADEKTRREGDTLSMERKFLELMKRKLRKKRSIAEAARQVVPVLEQQLGDVQADLQSQEGLAKELNHEADIMRQDVDIGLARFLSQEMAENSKRSDLAALLEEVDGLEAEVLQWGEEEKRQRKLVALLKGQRDIKQGEALRAQQAEKDTAQQVKMKQLVIADLSKRCNDTNNRLKEFSALYDVVKNERNKYVNLIQASHQALAEMKEKIKILHNEVDILRNESLAKDKALKKERVAHRASQAQRDGLRLEANNASMHYRTKQQVVEQQIVEIEKQNGVINALERDMLRLKAMYEAAVEQRNFAGVQLIDRNDELCVLYEKSNIQETTLKEGSLAITKREEDIRMLRLQVAELQRRLEAARRRTDKAPDGAENLVSMHEELQTKRAVTEQLSRDLEDPGNLIRWRALGGEDLSMEQLEATIVVSMP
ncbi:coiled-coil flagellar protein, move backward only 2 [Ectocarpus siliculosus]|uniref:Coiled-coil flagellar protein, move backward only 2 n=1 Tax=Ectocarpus siliculosus TaxID=2880 RepID=D7G000_ECTSI|nr:coiled-coil flagellar protein, move backward only 2 [Ectocarpus siliculosus]|eukprot:CBJ48625.1 coiled-coil flagellar protein, move backward only 2 [Ectocarpus siliculosus]